jgi:predicted Rossmann fold nucleotide-binding protein DprA/Smf involved in DNA uptake
VSEIKEISKGNEFYPSHLLDRLNFSAPDSFFVLGDERIIKNKKIALFCSIKCPGVEILKAYDLARSLRDESKTIIGGFASPASPIERDCFDILLRGRQPIIVCPARPIQGMRIPMVWRKHIRSGRLLVLSPYSPGFRRPTIEDSQKRNLFVAALADEVCFIYVLPNGKLEAIQKRVQEWGIPVINP